MSRSEAARRRPTRCVRILADELPEAAAPERGAGTAEEWKRDRRNVEQGPIHGMGPWSRSWARRVKADPTRVSGVRSPENHRGPSSTLRRAPLAGATQGGRTGARSRCPLAGATKEGAPDSDSRSVEREGAQAADTRGLNVPTNLSEAAAQAADAMSSDAGRFPVRGRPRWGEMGWCA